MVCLDERVQDAPGGIIDSDADMTCCSPTQVLARTILGSGLELV